MWKNGVVIVAFGSLFSGSAYAQSCVGAAQVKGKIVNNLHTPLAFHTMGVASVVFNKDSKVIKLKCALVGTPVVPPNPQDPTSVAFIHTISCDDEISSQWGPIHSKLQFNTLGTVNPATGSFTETSAPIAGSGTGLFEGVTGGLLTINGQIYPTGAIDMTFSGQACY
ncbi:MAG TPA: hypothetical protein VFT23_05260 [Burkholderiales bacterium]|nr:hypothetical protein [Burkholderiales bacterium]